jgi:hypothetical protein
VAVEFKDIVNLKRQPVARGPNMPSMQPRRRGLGGFPVTMAQQMRQPRLKFPKPVKPAPPKGDYE